VDVGWNRGWMNGRIEVGFPEEVSIRSGSEPHETSYRMVTVISFRMINGQDMKATNDLH
jgi:hypothetical protein